MCDERDRLIGYLYDECDTAERRDVEQHLEQCPTCRTEIQALRNVRADLLAWEVRGTPDVWRPFPAAAPAAWWQQVPSWAFAAAAGLVIAAGLGGGVAARALSYEAPVQQIVSTPAGVTAPDLTVAQERIIELMRQELAAQSRAMPAGPVRVAAQPDEQMLRRMNDLANANTENFKVMAQLYEDIMRYGARTESKIKTLQQSVDTLSAALNLNQNR